MGVTVTVTHAHTRHTHIQSPQELRKLGRAVRKQNPWTGDRGLLVVRSPRLRTRPHIQAVESGGGKASSAGSSWQGSAAALQGVSAQSNFSDRNDGMTENFVLGTYIV